MVPPLVGLQVLTRANRRHRWNISFGKPAKLARIVKKREVTRGLGQLAQMTMDSTSDAITMARQNRSHRRHLDAAAVALLLPFTIGWQRRLQRKIRELEASLFRMKDEYQGYRVKIYSIDQMQALEYLHSIGWRGNMINPRENMDIAERIDVLLRS